MPRVFIIVETEYTFTRRGTFTIAPDGTIYPPKDETVVLTLTNERLRALLLEEVQKQQS